MRIMIACGLLAAFSSSSVTAADVYVSGYYKKDGTYVQPHYRSDPDSSTNNNWSTRGNVNPHTGKSGTVDSNRNSYGRANSNWSLDASEPDDNE